MNDKVITSYKAFDKNMQCHDFQFEVGKEYEMDGEIECGKRGFHACKNPLELWDYYKMLKSRFAEVEQSGKIDKDGKSTKVCSSHIKIKAELKLADIINIGIEWLKNVTSPSKYKKDGVLDDSGHYAQIGSSGDCAKIGSSGDCAQIGSSGHGAQIGSSGDYAKIGSCGDCAKISSSGDCAQIDSIGGDSVIMCAGNNSRVKATVGSWITLAEWVWNDEKKRNVPICVKTEYVDGERIKTDTWYKLENGAFVEVGK